MDALVTDIGGVHHFCLIEKSKPRMKNFLNEFYPEYMDSFQLISLRRIKELNQTIEGCKRVSIQEYVVNENESVCDFIKKHKIDNIFTHRFGSWTEINFIRSSS